MSLPPPPNRFVGRERELVEVESAFASGARLVSLLGPPGVGKSRLAQQFASRARGSAYCELESARTIEDLCFVVRRELGAEAEASEPDRVGELLRARGELVLVLDAFEHLVVLAADAVTRWVARAATLRVLVTSRVRLATPAERVIELGPLPLPKTAADLEHAHSVQLLLERARAVGAPLRLDEAERRAILTIVRALDGLPLAIELAAARMRVVSPAQLVAQLEQRLDALGGTRGRDRHATLRDAIAWSWESLRDEERVALAECSVFVGGFDLDAAAAVLTAGSVVDVLQALRDHSLLSLRAQPSGSRFWILETIRDFAIERVEPALLERAREAHARYFTELAETVDPLRVSVPLLGAEVDNLLAMQRRAAAALDATDPDPVLVHRVIVAALALDPLLDLSGPSAVPTHALDLAVQLAERAHVPPALRARALLARAEALRWAGRLDEAGADLETAIKISGDAGETSLVAIGQYRAGSTLLMRGQTDAAKACYEASLRAARASRSPALEGRSIYGLTTAEYLSAGQSGVADRFEEALGIARATGDRRTEGHCLGALAAIRAIEDREGEALRLADEASRVLREIENRRPQTSLHMVRGMIDLARGDAPRAREEELRALVLARELGSVAYAADALTNLALVDLCLDRLDDARAAIEEARAMWRQLGSSVDLALLGARESLLWARQRRPDLAVQTMAQAERATEGEPTFQRTVWLFRGLLELELAKLEREAGRMDAFATHLASARERLRSLPALTLDSWVARKLLARGVERWDRSPAVIVAEDGRWVHLPGGERLDLERRPNLARLVARLAYERLAAPGHGVATHELLEAGWPGERVLPESGAQRVHVAISTLRRLGLRDLLVRGEGGYLFDPDKPLERALKGS